MIVSGPGSAIVPSNGITIPTEVGNDNKSINKIWIQCNMSLRKPSTPIIHTKSIINTGRYTTTKHCAMALPPHMYICLLIYQIARMNDYHYCCLFTFIMFNMYVMLYVFVFKLPISTLLINDQNFAQGSSRAINLTRGSMTYGGLLTIECNGDK